MVGAPTALHLVRCRNLGRVEDIVEGCFQDGEELLGLQAQGQRVETGLAAHRGEVNQTVGVVAHVLGAQVLDGVHGRHFQVRGVRLGEADIVLDEGVATGQDLAVCDTHVGCCYGAVVEVEGFDVHFFHDSIFS